MRLGIFDHGWWRSAVETLPDECIWLSAATHQSGNAYNAGVAERTQLGRQTIETLSNRSNESIDFLLDNSGTGMGFVPRQGDDKNLDIVHERLGKKLVSHFVDPIVTAFQGLPWQATWVCLQSKNWIKAVWDKAHAAELCRFGVPHVIHLPMAAPNRTYNTELLDPDQTEPIVSFVGGQNTSYFSRGAQTPVQNLLPAVLVQGVRSELDDMSFADIYYDLYQLAEPVSDQDDLQTSTTKVYNYFVAKLFYHACLCIQRRDRYVIFLSQKLGDLFRLHGSRWNEVYGIRAQPPIPTPEAYFDRFRKAAINVNFVNGNAETGLNMRHFEITAAGGFMLCPNQPELEECFILGEECVTFENEADLLDKIQYYLKHDDERMVIAHAGQQRTLSEHLFSHRLETLKHIFQGKSLHEESFLEVHRDRPVRTPPGPSQASRLPVEYSRTTWSDDLLAIVPQADVIVDGGANKGQMARGFRQLYPNAEIYSFEPVHEIFEQLKETCREVRVHPVRKALGSVDGNAQIHLTASPEANSMLEFQEGNPCAQWTRVVGREEVEVCTIDSWCQENNINPERIDVIKLDVQGGELEALKGARGVLQKAKAVYAEVSFVPIYKNCPLLGDIDQFMKTCGFYRHGLYPSDQPHNWGDALYIREDEKMKASPQSAAC